MQSLLIEIVTEELPPKALETLGLAFAEGIFKGLQDRDFLGDAAQWTPYATPRRLAVLITAVREVSRDKARREKVLPVSVALDKDHQPTAPLLKKLAALATSAGVPTISLQELERTTDTFFYNTVDKGVPLYVGLQKVIEDTVAKLPIPKQMSYQLQHGDCTGMTVNFVRPVHHLVVLHGKDVLPVTLFGLQANRITRGHRFLSAGELSLHAADDYERTLQEPGRVIASFTQRQAVIRQALLDAADGDQVLMPDALLNEVTALVEWPVVVAGHFEDAFLGVPQACLILTMQTNQKYFALTDGQGRLRSRFLIVSNLATTTPEHIIQGNERVIRPRLADAKFFFEQDQKKTLWSRVPKLSHVVYHHQLGSQRDRSERVATIAGAIAERLGRDVHQAQRAATLAKADLLTDMVGEFPELQGVMGSYYARHDGEPDNIATAIAEHYQPRFAGDALPVTDLGTVVALADKLETLVGIWGIGCQPTGEKDPFALRRHALGILRILLEKRLPLSLSDLLNTAVNAFASNAPIKDPRDNVLAFLYERLRGLLKERGYTAHEVDAVIAPNPEVLGDLIERLDAVRAFAALPEAQALAAANKRINNMLNKRTDALETRQALHLGIINESLLIETAEKNLFATLNDVKPHVNTAYACGDFTSALKALAQCRTTVDAFFNEVMVMAEDVALRNNRFSLLLNMHTMFNQVADISKLAV